MKRVKRRYLALQLDMAVLPNEKEFMDVVWGSVYKLYGEVGASLTSLALINFDLEHKIVIIRTSLATLCQVRASLTCITKIAGRDATVSILGVSGTVKALLDKVVKSG